MAAPTWLEKLDAMDPAEARQARSCIRALQRLGFDDAEGIVRRDLLGGQPEMATRLLGEAIRRATREHLTPEQLLADANRGGISASDEPDRFAAFVVARALSSLLDVISGAERLDAAPSELPGWQLMERGEQRRRLRLSGKEIPEDHA